MTRVLILAALLVLMDIATNIYLYPCTPGEVRTDSTGKMWACATVMDWR